MNTANDDRGDHTALKPGVAVDYFVQRHDAERAGRHYDVRLGDKTTGLLSWASRHALPEPGGRPRLLTRQALHPHAYGSFSGTILAGRGRGAVRLLAAGKARVESVGPNHLDVVLENPAGARRVRLVRIARDPEQWLARDGGAVRSRAGFSRDD